MKRSKAWKFGSTLLIFFLLAAFSAGCWGRQELENQSLVTVLGVDNGAGKRLRLTARIAIPRAAAGGPGGSGSTGPLGGLPITAEGEDMLDAVDAIQQITGRDVTMAHLTVLVVGEAFARTDVGPVVDVFSRMLQFRPNTLIVTCREKAEDFVKQFTPGEETEPSVMITKLIESTHTALGGTPFVTMQDFLSAYNTVDSDPWTPYMTLASAAAQDDSKEGSTGDMPGPETKGEVDKPVSEAVGGDEDKGDGKTESPKVVRVLGSAVYAKVGDHQRMVGTLDFHETMAANLLAGDFSNTVLEMAFPESHEEVSLRFRHASTRRKVRVEGNATFVTWVIRIAATIDEITVHATLEPLGAEFERDVVATAQEELGALLARSMGKLQELRSDPIKLGRSVHMKFATYPEWEQFYWPDRFPEVKYEFDITIHILNTGFVYRHPYPR